MTCQTVHTLSNSIIFHNSLLSLSPLPPLSVSFPFTLPSAPHHSFQVLKALTWNSFQRRGDMLKTSGPVRQLSEVLNVSHRLPWRHCLQADAGDHMAQLRCSGCCPESELFCCFLHSPACPWLRTQHGVWGQGLHGSLRPLNSILPGDLVHDHYFLGSMELVIQLYVPSRIGMVVPHSWWLSHA